MTVALHYVDEGPRDAPALVLSGSLGSTLAMWKPQVAALAGTFRVISVDHRGHGRSPVPPGPYRIADLAADVLALLDDLGLDRVAWCGLSMGGMVGMYLGSEAPHRLTSLTLCCTTAHFPNPAPMGARIAQVEAAGTASIASAVVANWFTPDWAATHPDVIAEYEAMIAGTPDDGYVACCRAVQAWDHRDRLAAVAVPTLVIAGARDPSTPADPHGRLLADTIPGAHLEIVDGAHLATVQQPEQTSALIGDFIV